MDASFIGCNFELADLSRARVTGCTLTRSRFRETDLSGADLEEADLSDADLLYPILDGTKLAGADLRGAEISGLDLRRFGNYAKAKITVEQQYPLLAAMGVDVRGE